MTSRRPSRRGRDPRAGGASDSRSAAEPGDVRLGGPRAPRGAARAGLARRGRRPATRPPGRRDPACAAGHRRRRGGARARRIAPFSSSSSTGTSRPPEEAEHHPLLGPALRARPIRPSRGGLPRHAQRSSLAVFATSVFQRAQASGILEARDVPALGIDQDERRLVRRAEASRERPARITDRRPGPAVAAHERLCARGRVRRVQAEEPKSLPLPSDPSCVGDRLAVADASPRRPHVDDHRLAAEVRECQALAVERDPRDLRPLRLCLGCSRGGEANHETNITVSSARPLRTATP